MFVLGCSMNFKYYPYDTQTCLFKLRSVRQPRSQVNGRDGKTRPGLNCAGQQGWPGAVRVDDTEVADQGTRDAPSLTRPGHGKTTPFYTQVNLTFGTPLSTATVNIGAGVHARDGTVEWELLNHSGKLPGRE